MRKMVQAMSDCGNLGLAVAPCRTALLVTRMEPVKYRTMFHRQREKEAREADSKQLPRIEPILPNQRMFQLWSLQGIMNA